MVKLFIVLLSLLPGGAGNEPIDPAPAVIDWVLELEKQIAGIENTINGSLGVYVKHLGDNRSLSYNANHPWYLASATKIPMAIAVLQKVESGCLSLDDKLILSESDYVDGAGDILWQKPGTSYTISTLMEKMIQDSDNTATDMIFRLIGEEELNLAVKQTMVPEGLNRITSILQVRHDAFSEFHENAVNLSNLDILFVNSTRCRTERLNRLISRMAVEESELKAASVADAFERYYERQLNSGNLESMGLLLERLYKGELLTAEHTRWLLDVMVGVRTGDRRIKAGLAEGYNFVHKTGTQINRTVHVGIIQPENGKNGYPLIIAACVKTDELAEAENALKEIGQSISHILHR